MERTANQAPVMVVTGSGRGIGEGIAELAIQRGYAVLGIDVSFAESTSVVLQAAENEGKYIKLTADISLESVWTEKIIPTVEERFGRLDVLVNNAAISPKTNGVRTPSAEMSLEEWNLVLNVNLTSVFLGCRSAYPLMKRQNFGRIITVSSQAGREGARIAGLHYGASKAADIGITRTLAREWGGDGITVNVLTPGRIVTGMSAQVADEVNQKMLDNTPIGRFGYPNDVAELTLFVASPEAGFITGAVLDVNGGGFIG